jgi:hypothetical protein
MLLILLFCGGCRFITSHIFVSSIEKIYGNYSLQKPEATVQLELARDMRFKETIRFSSGKTAVLTGAWRFPLIDDEGDVELDGAADLSNSMSPESINHIDTGMEAQNWIGKTRLCADANLSLYFVKLQTK